MICAEASDESSTTHSNATQRHMALLRKSKASACTLPQDPARNLLKTCQFLIEFRLCQSGNLENFLRLEMPAHELNLMALNAQRLGENFDDRLIRLSPFGWRHDLDLQRLAQIPTN